MIEIKDILQQRPLIYSHLTDVATALVSLEALYDAFYKEEKNEITFRAFAFRYEQKLQSLKEEFAWNISATTILKNTKEGYKDKFIELFNRYLGEIVKADYYKILKLDNWEEKEVEIWLHLMNLKHELIEYTIKHLEENCKGIAYFLEFLNPLIGYWYTSKLLKSIKLHTLRMAYYINLAEKIVKYHNEHVLSDYYVEKEIKDIPNLVILKNYWVISIKVFSEYFDFIKRALSIKNAEQNRDLKDSLTAQEFKQWFYQIRGKLPTKQLNGQTYYVITQQTLRQNPLGNINSLSKLRDFLKIVFNLDNSIYRTVRLGDKVYKAILIPSWIIE